MSGHGMPRVISQQPGQPVAYASEPIPDTGQPARCWQAVATAVALLTAHLGEDDGILSGNIVDIAGAASGNVESRGIIWALLHIAAAALRGLGPDHARAVLASLGAAAAAEGREAAS